MVREVASALVAAHRGNIVHRDLKPDNVFLARDPEAPSGTRIKLLDFGIAKLLWPDTGLSTRTGTIIGTPTYMAPEQCRGVAVDHRVDLYSLGCIFFELLTGQPPFRGEGVGDVLAAHVHVPAPRASSLAPEVPAALDALVARLLAKAPSERLQTAAALRDALDDLPSAGPVARPASQRASADDSVTRPMPRSDGDTTEPNPVQLEVDDLLDVLATAPRPIIRPVSPAATTQPPPSALELPGPPSLPSTPASAPAPAVANADRPSVRNLVIGFALAAAVAGGTTVWLVRWSTRPPANARSPAAATDARAPDAVARAVDARPDATADHRAADTAADAGMDAIGIGPGTQRGARRDVDGQHVPPVDADSAIPIER